MTKLSLNISSLEIVLLFLFIFYLIFQVKTPMIVSDFVTSNLGMIIVLIITVYLFLYTNPILGIVSIFVIYELMRRSSLVYSDHAIYGSSPSTMYQPTPDIIKRKISKNILPRNRHNSEMNRHNSEMNSYDSEMNSYNSEINQEEIYNYTQSVPIIQYTTEETNRAIEMHKMNPPTSVSLEEELVQTLSPVGEGKSSEYVNTLFKPVSNSVHNAAMM